MLEIIMMSGFYAINRILQENLFTFLPKYVNTSHFCQLTHLQKEKKILKCFHLSSEKMINVLRTDDWVLAFWSIMISCCRCVRRKILLPTSFSTLWYNNQYYFALESTLEWLKVVQTDVWKYYEFQLSTIYLFLHEDHMIWGHS